MGAFFVRRPIVAIVIAILMTMAGAVAMTKLPTAQYPDIVPPQIQVTTTYTGADAITIEQSVATPIEQQMNGVDYMIYMQSINANDGTMKLTVTFDVETDINFDQVNTQNRVSQAQPNLPADVNQFGLTVKKATSNPLLIVSLYSPKGTYDALFLGNYATINVNDAIYRVPGVGQIQNYGTADYAMRIWVKPERLASLGLTVPDLMNAVKQQSTVNPAGGIGTEPAPKGQEFTYTLRARGRLETAEEFGNVVVRLNPDGSMVRLKDVSRIELGALNYQQRARLNGKPSCPIGVFQVPGSNAIAVAEGVKKTMQELKERFPDDLDYVVALDTTLPVTEGIKEIDAYPLRGDLPRHHRRVPVPAGVARDAHSAARGAGLARRHVHVLSDARLLDQHAFALRPRPRHRPRRGRRDRRRRGGRAPHRARSFAEGRHVEGDGGGHSAGHRNRPRPLRRVHPRGLHGRDPGADEHAVRHHDRRLGPDLGLQRPVAVAGALFADPETQEGVEGSRSGSSSPGSTGALRR